MPRILLIASRTWDESKLQQIFFYGNVADIKQIPVSGAITIWLGILHNRVC
jgi:hypothetical protein